MKALILTGQPAPVASRADEADTLVQADQIRRLLEATGWSVSALELTPDLPAAESALLDAHADLVFNLVESIGGRGEFIHLAPALLDRLGLPYTGCPQAAIYLSSNKILAKRLLSLAGMPVPAMWDPAADCVPADDARQLGKRLWIVKSVWEHASLGLDAGSIVSGARVADRLARCRARYGGEWFAEAFVPGREFNLSLLDGPEGPEVLPPAEIDFGAWPAGKPRIVDYAAKWDETSFEYRNTPRRFRFPDADDALLSELRRLALDAWRLFGLRGYARVDFRVDTDGRAWILEVNANPCLSADAGFMAAAAEAGMQAAEVVRRIVSSTPIHGDRHSSRVEACS